MPDQKRRYPRLRLLCGISADLALLIFWLLALWIFDKIARLIGNDQHLDWSVAKWTFAISALLSVDIFIYFDLRTSYVTYRAEFEEVKEDLEEGGAVGARKAESDRAGVGEADAQLG